MDSDDTAVSREDLLVRTFVQLADNLVDDFDAVDLMSVLADRTVDLLEASAAGLLLADAQGVLQVLAASNQAAHLLELFQLQNREGPCMDCFQAGVAVASDDLARDDRWPRFRIEAAAAGFRSVCAVPMRVRDRVIGALNMFGSTPRPLPPSDVLLAQALADVATITILQERTIRDAQVLSEQLQRALNSRVIIEQAKGTVAERAGVGVEEAFRRMRDYARSTRRRLTDVAEDVLAGRVAVESLLADPQ